MHVISHGHGHGDTALAPPPSTPLRLVSYKTCLGRSSLVFGCLLFTFFPLSLSEAVNQGNGVDVPKQQ